MAKKYGHLIKPLVVHSGPEGVYDEPRFWLDSKGSEGLGAHFSYGFLKTPGTVCHPTRSNEVLVHPYDEVLVFAPCDASGDILDLGAEISIELGKESEEQVFYEPSVVVIPKGTPHGPVTVRRLDKPIAHYLVGLNSEYKAESIPKNAKTTGSNYAHLIKKFRGAWLLFSKRLARPARPDTARLRVTSPGNADQIAWFNGKDLEGVELNISWGFYSNPGIWHGMGRGGAHVHPVDEALFFLGLDYQNINYLGAELEIGLGEEDERHLISRPTVVIAPKNVVHCPIITRWVDKPYAHFHLYLGARYETRWLTAELP